jgi:hypothetical protein
MSSKYSVVSLAPKVLIRKIEPSNSEYVEKRRLGMALSGKYGKLSIPRIGEEEPVFLLRAQDKLTEPAIEMYRVLATSHGCQIANAVQKEIERFRQWQGKKKLPD